MFEEMSFRPEIIKSRLDGRPVKWLADKTGIRSRRLYYIISGGDEPSASELMALARVFSMEPEEFMSGVPAPTPARRATDREQAA